MGAWGSGRWGLHSKATTVEDCRVLDLGEFARKGAFVPWYAGSVSWPRGAEVVASVGYTVRPAGGGLILRLSYRWPPAGGAGGAVEWRIALGTSPCHFGGAGGGAIAP